jgi:hypothetical protein
MNEAMRDDFARRTAEDILERHTPDCLDRAGLRDAIARLARHGLEGYVRLFEAEHLRPPAE